MTIIDDNARSTGKGEMDTTKSIDSSSVFVDKTVPQGKGIDSVVKDIYLYHRLYIHTEKS